MATYTAVHKIIVKRGTKEAPKRVPYEAGTEGIELSETEAKELLERGAVKAEATKSSGSKSSGSKSSEASQSSGEKAGDGLNE